MALPFSLPPSGQWLARAFQRKSSHFYAGLAQIGRSEFPSALEGIGFKDLVAVLRSQRASLVAETRPLAMTLAALRLASGK